ncbi:MAG: tryptophan-rich sensory protein [Firmicutes bacterium]|nr:tryptophan-rich sensory protein [Bacillota bacterium]
MNIKKLISYIVITLLVGSFFTLFIMDSFNIYNTIDKPFLSPNKIVFPIVWSVLYILMGISLYIVSESKYLNKDKSYLLYILQLLVNSVWPLFFFKFRLFFVSFLIVLLLIYLVIKLILEFYKINKLAAYLQIPYLLWLIFASYLSLGVFLLN